MTIRNPGIWERVLLWLSSVLSDLQRGVENRAFAITWQRINPDQVFAEWLEDVPETFTDPDVRDELLGDTGMRAITLIEQRLERAVQFVDTDGDALFTETNPGWVT